MNIRRTWRGGWLRTLVLLALYLTGCQTWQPLWSSRAEKPAADKAAKQAATELDKPRSRSTGRSPIQSTGVNEQSREIERSLGAR